MFAKLLLDDEKKNFLKLLAYLSKIDGEIAPEEIKFVENIAIELGISSTNIFNEEIDLDDICCNFKSLLSKNVVILELINIAYADREYKQSEKDGIKIIAQRLDVNTEKIDEIEQWINDGIIWSEKGSKIINS